MLTSTRQLYISGTHNQLVNDKDVKTQGLWELVGLRNYWINKQLTAETKAVYNGGQFERTTLKTFLRKLLTQRFTTLYNVTQ